MYSTHTWHNAFRACWIVVADMCSDGGSGSLSCPGAADEEHSTCTPVATDGNCLAEGADHVVQTQRVIVCTANDTATAQDCRACACRYGPPCRRTGRGAVHSDLLWLCTLYMASCVQATLVSAADVCTSPQFCTGTGSTPGKCVTPVPAGAVCKQAAVNTAAGELHAQSNIA